MPVASVDENDGAKGGKDKIRPARQILAMEPVAESGCP